jgi:HTH-type transcriptional regulator, sugar sensing transcriptional regulator
MKNVVNSPLEGALREAGLTDYEARIYLALLELGEASTTQILKLLGTHIGRIYDILDTLAGKGLISITIKNGVKYATAADPKRILDYVERRKQEIEQQAIVINEALPQLHGLMSIARQSPHVEIYTGIEGLKTAFQKELDRYKAGANVIVLGVTVNISYPTEALHYFLHTIYSARERLKVNVKKLNDVASRGDNRKNEPSAEIRYLEMNSSISLNVIEDLSILMISYEPLVCIVIEDKEVANGFRSHFEHLWAIAKK